MSHEKSTTENGEINQPLLQSIASYDNLTLLEDVLPSFEMHNYMFNRTIYDTENLSSLECPPNYDDMTNSNNNGGTNPVDTNNFVDPTENPNALLLNNIEKFQKIDLPLKVQVVLTKSIPKIGLKSERENPLRQYRPGEVLCGYVTIENKSNDPIPFEMFLVSLEGETTVPHPSKPDELIRRKFLKTYDLSACFHYGCIDLESQGVTLTQLDDPYDNTLLGFTNDRIIQPQTKHKKIFAFKLPHYLLDTSCFEQLPSHLKLPPSLGVDNKAFAGQAKYIKVDSFRGYGRLDAYGSPIKTNDFATDGQSISYFISVQFIGRKLDFYKKFYTHETNHEYDFIFLKNVEYYFRIDASSTDDDKLNETLYHELPTDQQLKIIEKLVQDKLQEALERKDLNQIGIDDLRHQDEIIFSNVANSKKARQLPHDYLVPMLSDSKISAVDMASFSQKKCVKVTKDFFSKVDGELKVELGIDRNFHINSIKPKKMLSSASETFSTVEQPPLPNSLVQSSFYSSPLSPSLSSTSITSHRSHRSHRSPSPPTQIQSIDSNLRFNQKEGSIYVNLTFKDSNSSKSSKPNLPSTIMISPTLKIYNIQSPYPLPITFDNEFIFNGGLDKENLQILKSKYSFYYQQLVDVLRDLDKGLARSMYNKINGISKIHVTEQSIKKFFESQTINLHNQWKFNEHANVFECEFQIPLILDPKNPEKISSYSIIPSFQQCHIGRFYAVDFDISVKKAKTKINMKFPVTVV